MKNDAGKICKETPFPISKKEKLWVKTVLNSLTLKEKVAQLVFPWVLGNYTSEEAQEFRRIKRLVEKEKVGGLIFFKGDVVNEAMLIDKMQKLTETPLLVASDFERGVAMRLSDAYEFPFSMAIAAADDVKLTEEFAEITGIECRAIGVHQNYAPVADINSNSKNPIVNTRAFSDDIKTTNKHVNAFIKGCQKGKVISTVKHFPGHGDTEIDSHNEMPVINKTLEELLSNELKPFINAIENGVQSVMTGHLLVPSLDSTPHTPSSLSENILTKLLKEKLGFKGLVVTDAMNMSAITNHFSVGEAAVKGIKAGVDLFLMSPNEDIAINSIYNAVTCGEITEERINESVEKLLTAKAWLKLYKRQESRLEDLQKIVSSESHKEIADKIAEKSITLVKNDSTVFPFIPKKYNSISIIPVTEESAAGAERIFLSEMNSNFDNLYTKVLRKNATDKDYKEAMITAKAGDVTIMPVYVKFKAYSGTVQLKESHLKFINQVIKDCREVVVISFGNPYTLNLMPDLKTYICGYGDVIATQKAAAKRFLIKMKFKGKLPVKLK